MVRLVKVKTDCVKTVISLCLNCCKMMTRSDKIW